MNPEWIRLALTIIAYAAWFAPLLVNMVNKHRNGSAPMEKREEYITENEEYQEPKRNLSRRKVGGHIWSNDLRRIQRMVEETERALLNSIATGEPLGTSLKAELMNKLKEVARMAREMEEYAGGDS